VSEGWPVGLRGVTESLVATRGPDDRWNLAALGLRAAPTATEEGGGDGAVTARTWGTTRTRRNFAERGRGHVQFTRDAVDFVEASLGILERDEPILESAGASVEVTVERIDEGETGGTTWVEWSLEPRDSSVHRRPVPTTNRGYNAVIEGTVAASRLGVQTYDDDTLRGRLRYFERVVDECGGPAELDAWDRLRELTDAEW